MSPHLARKGINLQSMQIHGVHAACEERRGIQVTQGGYVQQWEACDRNEFHIIFLLSSGEQG